MPKMVKRAASSPWLWMVLIAGGGCAIGESLRQSANVGRLREQKQQERGDEIRLLSAQIQNALQALENAIPEDNSDAKALVDGIGTAQGMIVERAVAIEDGARKSEEWQTAVAEVVGDPKRRIDPDTPQEDSARTDFTERARTAGRIRRAAAGLGNVIRSAATGGSGSAPQGSNGWALAVGGISTLLLGGGGLAATVGRRAIKNVVQRVESIGAEDQNRKVRDEQRDADHADMQEQVASLAELTEKLEKRLEATDSSSQPAQG